jgi:hypothetical protein
LKSAQRPADRRDTAAKELEMLNTDPATRVRGRLRQLSAEIGDHSPWGGRSRWSGRRRVILVLAIVAGSIAFGLVARQLIARRAHSESAVDEEGSAEPAALRVEHDGGDELPRVVGEPSAV